MVDSETDNNNVNISNVTNSGDKPQQQVNGISSASEHEDKSSSISNKIGSIQPAIIQTSSAIVPLRTSDKGQIEREEQYRPLDPELGSDAIAQSFHQLPPPYSVDHDHDGITRADFESAIELCGYGKFHYILLGICGLVSTSEEMDVISMSFILPSAQCDLNLNTHTKGWLNCIIFIGMMVGAYFWGSVADSLGRKRVLIVISFMNALCIVASSFSQNYEVFLIFRFLNGAGL